MYLVDTNVISEMRKAGTKSCAPAVQGWLNAVQSADLYLSAITILELETGILLAHQKDAAKSEVLRRWLHGQVIPAFSDRILPIDIRVALLYATLRLPATRSRNDAFIAATALAHGLTVVTRNERDFVGTGVSSLNPWEM